MEDSKNFILQKSKRLERVRSFDIIAFSEDKWCSLLVIPPNYCAKSLFSVHEKVHGQWFCTIVCRYNLTSTIISSEKNPSLPSLPNEIILLCFYFLSSILYSWFLKNVPKTLVQIIEFISKRFEILIFNGLYYVFREGDAS